MGHVIDVRCVDGAQYLATWLGASAFAVDGVRRVVRGGWADGGRADEVATVGLRAVKPEHNMLGKTQGAEVHAEVFIIGMHNKAWETCMHYH